MKRKMLPMSLFEKTGRLMRYKTDEVDSVQISSAGQSYFIERTKRIR